ncbi:MAG: hypothetical protein AB1456_12035, partial [Thermodesulfobacteriota bacterium]
MKHNIYALLDQHGPFRTRSHPLARRIFSPEAREWLAELGKSGLVTKYRVTRNQVFELLAVRSYAEAQALLKDPAAKATVERRAYALLG